MLYNNQFEPWFTPRVTAAATGWSLVAHTGAVSADTRTVVSSPINTTGANLIIVAALEYNSLSLVLTDSALNTWTLAASKTDVARRSYLYYCFNPTTSIVHTFTWHDGVNVTFPALFIQAWSDANTSPLDQNTTGSTGSATSLTCPTGITPTQTNELIVSCVSSTVTGAFSINGGFTISDTSFGNTNSVDGGMAYLIETAIAAQNPTWSWTGASDATTVLASFKRVP